MDLLGRLEMDSSSSPHEFDTVHSTSRVLSGRSLQKVSLSSSEKDQGVTPPMDTLRRVQSMRLEGNLRTGGFEEDPSEHFVLSKSRSAQTLRPSRGKDKKARYHVSMYAPPSTPQLSDLPTWCTSFNEEERVQTDRNKYDKKILSNTLVSQIVPDTTESSREYQHNSLKFREQNCSPCTKTIPDIDEKKSRSMPSPEPTIASTTYSPRHKVTVFQSDLVAPTIDRAAVTESSLSVSLFPIQSRIRCDPYEQETKHVNRSDFHQSWNEFPLVLPDKRPAACTAAILADRRTPEISPCRDTFVALIENYVGLTTAHVSPPLCPEMESHTTLSLQTYSGGECGSQCDKQPTPCVTSHQTSHFSPEVTAPSPMDTLENQRWFLSPSERELLAGIRLPAPPIVPRPSPHPRSQTPPDTSLQEPSSSVTPSREGSWNGSLEFQERIEALRGVRCALFDTYISLMGGSKIDMTPPSHEPTTSLYITHVQRALADAGSMVSSPSPRAGDMSIDHVYGILGDVTEMLSSWERDVSLRTNHEPDVSNN